ncbi:hypothetical protein T12_14042 [Trichinella patagoniensis]|uniref:Uncharacterized protein n=1 Tax=Trichinella patagoniensis TaxID=990121 RepID=A0A0V0Z711_9BILA|nr:hypothetical protein T12_14042 [Trichinella patagoniensis]
MSKQTQLNQSTLDKPVKSVARDEERTVVGTYFLKTGRPAGLCQPDKLQMSFLHCIPVPQSNIAQHPNRPANWSTILPSQNGAYAMLNFKCQHRNLESNLYIKSLAIKFQFSISPLSLTNFFEYKKCNIEPNLFWRWKRSLVRIPLLVDVAIRVPLTLLRNYHAYT